MSSLVGSRDRPIGLGLIAAGIMAAVWAVQTAVKTDSVLDFHSYEVSASRWLSGGSMYLAEQQHLYELPSVAGRGFVYPPTAMLLLAPLTRLGPAIFLTLSVSVLIGSLLSILRAQRALTWMSGGLLMTLTAFSIPFIRAVGIGNVTLLITAALGAGYIGLAELGGLIGGLTKMSTAAIGALYGWRGITFTAVGSVGVAAITVPIVGLESWAAYSGAIAAGVPYCERSASLACALIPSVGASGAKLACLIVGVGVMSLCVLTRNRFRRLVFVTASLIITTTEFTLTGQYVIYLYPMLTVLGGRLSLTGTAKTKGAYVGAIVAAMVLTWAFGAVQPA